MLDNNSTLLSALRFGLWPIMVLISEIVQTFILADFCYYYVKRYSCYSFTSFCLSNPFHKCKLCIKCLVSIFEELIDLVHGLMSLST
jgi:hypothetical protein